MGILQGLFRKLTVLVAFSVAIASHLPLNSREANRELSGILYFVQKEQ